jgi:FkbM family methyltransferase
LKLKNLFEIVGIRERPKHYGYALKKFQLENGITVNYAQWLHPKDKPKSITDEQVGAYKKILNQGDFCIDIGAHSGDSTLPIAIAVGLEGAVLALEPNHYAYHVLEKNARANREIANIHTMQAAAYARECYIEFEYSDSGYCNGGRHENLSVFSHGHAYKLNVFCVNLENELITDYSDLLPKLRFIKVDTEGFDLYVLRSLSAIIKEFRPYIKTEVFKKTSTEYRRDLFEFLVGSGYSLFKIDQEPIGIGTAISLDDMNSWAHFDILAVPKMG